MNLGGQVFYSRCQATYFLHDDAIRLCLLRHHFHDLHSGPGRRGLNLRRNRRPGGHADHGRLSVRPEKTAPDAMTAVTASPATVAISLRPKLRPTVTALSATHSPAPCSRYQNCHCQVQIAVHARVSACIFVKASSTSILSCASSFMRSMPSVYHNPLHCRCSCRVPFHHHNAIAISA